jgi:hypothetical protein
MPTPRARHDAVCGLCACFAADPALARIVHLYRCQQWSTYRIAEVAAVSRQRVARQLRRAGVTLRPRGAGGTRPDRRASDPPDLESLLRSWYVDSRMTSVEISDKLGIPQRRIRTRLAEYGITRRTRGGLNREDRTELDRDVLDHWYTDAQLPAADVGAITSTSGGIVLRNAHDLGVAVRLGGPAPRRGPTEITLVDALYDDPGVAAILTAHQVPVVPAGRPLWERFPQRVPLTGGLARALYCDAGVSTADIALLTGQPAATVARYLRGIGVDLRPPGGRSPFRQRWRARGRDGPRSSRHHRTPRLGDQHHRQRIGDAVSDGQPRSDTSAARARAPG